MSEPQKSIEKIVCFVKAPTQRHDTFYNQGYVLHAIGEVVRFEMAQQGECLEDWIINEPSPAGFQGILVWEGVCENRWSMNHGNDWEPWLVGSWRKPTAHELWAMANNSQQN